MKIYFAPLGLLTLSTGSTAMLWTSSRLGYRLVIDRVFSAEAEPTM